MDRINVSSGSPPHSMSRARCGIGYDMTLFSGPLDGHAFASDKPFVILGWPSKNAVRSFASKREVWSHLDAASRTDKRAIFARVYEFHDGVWHRIPAQPTYLQRLELESQMAA
jgi:hypothetical protein